MHGHTEYFWKSLPEAATVVVFEEENGEGAREWEDL